MVALLKLQTFNNSLLHEHLYSLMMRNATVTGFSKQND